jgi:hypothetical protein
MVDDAAGFPSTSGEPASSSRDTGVPWPASLVGCEGVARHGSDQDLRALHVSSKFREVITAMCQESCGMIALSQSWFLSGEIAAKCRGAMVPSRVTATSCMGECVAAAISDITAACSPLARHGEIIQRVRPDRTCTVHVCGPGRSPCSQV